MENFKPDNLNNEAPKEEIIPTFDALADAGLEKQRQAIRQSADQVFAQIRALTDEKNDENKFPLSDSSSVVGELENKKEFYEFLQKKLDALDMELKVRLAGGMIDEAGDDSVRDPHILDEKRVIAEFGQN